jgi:hypothetical protein
LCEGFFEFKFGIVIVEIEFGFGEVKGGVFGVVFGVEFGTVTILEEDAEGFDFGRGEGHLNIIKRDVINNG